MKEGHDYPLLKSCNADFQDGGCFGLQIWLLSRDPAVQESTPYNLHSISGIRADFLSTVQEQFYLTFCKENTWTNAETCIHTLTVEFFFSFTGRERLIRTRLIRNST